MFPLKIVNKIISYIETPQTLGEVGGACKDLAAMVVNEIQHRLKARAIVVHVTDHVIKQLGVRAAGRLSSAYGKLELLYKTYGHSPCWTLYQELSCLICQKSTNTLRTEGIVEKSEHREEEGLANLTFECLGGSQPCHTLYKLTFSGKCQRNSSHCQNYLLQNAPAVKGKP